MHIYTYTVRYRFKYYKQVKFHNNMTNETSTIRIGQEPYPQNTKAAYDLVATKILHNDKPTGRQMISYKGNYISNFSERYIVLANEDLFNTADTICRKLDLEPVLPNHSKYGKNDGQSWYKVAPFGNAILSNGVGQKGDGAYMLATFLGKKEVDVTGNGDFVRAGVTIKGSIDGSSATQVIPTDNRNQCMNTNLHLGTNYNVENEPIRKLNAQIHKDVAELATLRGIWYHTRKVETKDLAEIVSLGVDRANQIVQEYQNLKNLKVTKQMGADIVYKLGKKLAKELSYIDIEKKSDKITVDNIDQWSALNEITEKLTHGDIAKNMAVVLRRYSQLDNIFTPQIQVK